MEPNPGNSQQLEVYEYMREAWARLSDMTLGEIDELGLVPLAAALSRWLDNVG